MVTPPTESSPVMIICPLREACASVRANMQQRASAHLESGKGAGLRMMVTERLRAAVKLSPVPAYKLAIQVNLHPSALSQILHGARRVAPNDPRISRLATVLGLQLEDCLADEGT
jgi:hypothetical protein